MTDPLVTIVIPVLHDAVVLASLLSTIDAGDPGGPEIIVVDGGEAGDPAMQALRERHPGVTWVRSAPGRGLQMNEGARCARGRWLLFLHADTRLGTGWMEVLRRHDAQPRVVGGSFRFALDSPRRLARWIERGVRIRVRLFDLAYGDQALFVRRTVFTDLGGYRELPLMEDVDFVLRLRRRGSLAHVEVPALTSARRWERDGWLRRTLANVTLTALYLAGAPPERLARRYYRAGKAGDPSATEKRLRPCRAEDEQIRGEASAEARAGGGAPAPVKKRQ